MSQICMRGLVGDSSMSSRVRPGTSAPRTALGSGSCASDPPGLDAGQQQDPVRDVRAACKDVKHTSLCSHCLVHCLSCRLALLDFQEY